MFPHHVTVPWSVLETDKVNDFFQNLDSLIKCFPECTVGWLVVLGLTALWDSISVYIGPSPQERENEERKDRLE